METSGDTNGIWGEHESGTLGQFFHIKKGAEAAVLLADGHPGHVMPVGCVAAYDGLVNVTAVGTDIGCGTRVAPLGIKRADFTEKQLDKLADKLAKRIQFREGDGADSRLFYDTRWEMVEKVRTRNWLKDKARSQLGSCGGGNHYVDVLEDEGGELWVAVHFGSRGLGFAIHGGATSVAQGRKWEEPPRPKETIVSVESDVGRQYMQLMSLALDYAAEGRGKVIDEVARCMGASAGEAYDASHNMARMETVDGKIMVVVRKGATPLDGAAFVGGSMAHGGAIVAPRADLSDEGRRGVLNSTVHGAGRVLSRSAAKAGAMRVSERSMHAQVEGVQARLRGGDVDEAPQVYRKLDDVLGVHEGSIDVIKKLRSVIVLMAGANEHDPYKD